METEVVKFLLNTLNEIRQKTTDRSEMSGASYAITTIKRSREENIAITLKAARDELFHHKGPLHDSLDRSEDLIALRSTAYDAVKKAINHFTNFRQATATASKKTS